MSYKTAVATFSIIIAGGIVTLFLLNSGDFPVAFVGAHPITSKTLEEVSSAASQYYDKLVSTYGGDSHELDKKESRQELRRAALDKLIEERMIHIELKRRLGGDLGVVVRSKIAEIVQNKEFQNAAAVLYGLNFDDFSRLFLIPQAEREILEGRLFLEKKDINDWMPTAKNDSRVTILTPEFSWNGKTIEPRN